MSKTTRSSEKARSKTSSRRDASVKETNPEKKAPIVSKKQKINQLSTPPATAVQDSEKKARERRKTAVAGKSASVASASNNQTLAQPLAQTPLTQTIEDAPSQLLRRTKTTASALSQLEKGIELIHRKDFKKAVSELQSLIEKYPGETAIIASARSYVEICKRGEARQKKTPAAQNQAYAMGVLEHNKANYDKAIGFFRQSLEKYPSADYIYYSIAASMALKGDISAALENLRKAVELNVDSRIHAKNDPDFAPLESNREYMELVGIPLPRQL